MQVVHNRMKYSIYKLSAKCDEQTVLEVKQRALKYFLGFINKFSSPVGCCPVAKLPSSFVSQLDPIHAILYILYYIFYFIYKCNKPDLFTLSLQRSDFVTQYNKEPEV